MFYFVCWSLILLASGEAVLHEFDWGRQWVSLKSTTPIDSEGLDLLHLRTGDYDFSRDSQEFLCVFHLLGGLRGCTDSQDIFSNHTETRILGSFSDRINVAVLDLGEASAEWFILTLGVLTVSEPHGLTWNAKTSFNLTVSRKFEKKITISQGEQSGKVWVRRNVADDIWGRVLLTEIDSDWKGMREIRLELIDSWSLNGQFPPISDWNENMLWMFRESISSLAHIFAFPQSCNVSFSDEHVALIESDADLDAKRIRFLPSTSVSRCDFSLGTGILCTGYLWMRSTSSFEAALTYIPRGSSDPIQAMSFRDVFDQSSRLSEVIGLAHDQLLVYGDQGVNEVPTGSVTRGIRPALAILNSTKLLERFSGSQSSENTCLPSKDPMKFSNIPEEVITSVIELESRSDPDTTRNAIAKVRRVNDSTFIVFLEAGEPMTEVDPASVHMKLFVLMISLDAEKTHQAHSHRRNFWLPFALSLALAASLLLAIPVFSRSRPRTGDSLIRN